MTEPVLFPLALVLGAVVATERSVRQRTQAELATLAGVHPMALSKVERGIQADVGVETIARIAVGLSAAGEPVTAASLIATAERLQTRLHEAWARGDCPSQTSLAPRVKDGSLRHVLRGAEVSALAALLPHPNESIP